MGAYGEAERRNAKGLYAYLATQMIKGMVKMTNILLLVDYWTGLLDHGLLDWTTASWTTGLHIALYSGFT